MEPLVYVALLNWERPDDTAECVESVMRSHYLNHRIVVVDNGSRDGSVQRLRRQFPEVRVLETGANLGFAAGMNVAITFAMEHGADDVLILNNDATVDPHLLGQLVEVTRARPKLGIVGPTVLFYDDRERVWYGGGRRHWYWPAIVSLPAKPPECGVDTVIPVDVVSGCGMLVTRAVFEAVGLLDTRFFMYYEDSDFCLRAKENGYDIGYVPLARMWHKVSASTSDDVASRTYLRARSKAIFYKRYARGLAAVTAWAFIISSAVWTAFRYVWSGQRSFLKPYLSGFTDGLLTDRQRWYND
ncbi:MAG: glycosyltransferase family 2 protein [Chloroflexi bacterium]|nr:glycosyltransferase family 2 protein [Chloroflexota bacterium]